MMNADVNAVIEDVEKSTTDSTAERYAGAIRVWAKWCATEEHDPFAATSLDIRNYLQHLHDAEGYAYQTLTVHRAALSKFFTRAVELAKNGRDVPDPRKASPVEPLEWENPSQEMSMGDLGVSKAEKATKRDQALDGEEWQSLSPDEVEDMIANAPAPVVRNELLLRLAYECMMRRGEVARLKKSDVDHDRRAITIRAEISKTGQERTVPWVSNRVDTLMGIWLNADREASRYSDSEYLFITQKSGQLADYTVSNIVRTAAENAESVQETLYTDAMGRDISKVTGHELRRAGARRRWNNGTDIYTIKELLGHESIETTRRYIRAEEDQLIEKGRANW